jgi:glycerol-3-phosphate dehydrogenase
MTVVISSGSGFSVGHRPKESEMSDTQTVDLFIIGGGINGAGIARDAAGRGLSVILCEKDDLAQGTSSRSGKLVHGGLRYLEYYEFRLVREALIEREVLLNAASHIIWPMRFVLPHSPDDRPAWLVRLGLFLYDHLGGRKKLPGTRTLDLRRDPEGAPIKDQYKRGFEYSDCWVDDARLVVLNALDAAERGAQVLTRTACISARRDGKLWRVEMQDTRTGQKRLVMARALVNAGGPWVNDIIGRVTGTNSTRNVRLVKGSHIITPKFWDGPHAYLVQNHDKRVIFINPYEGDKALIGTTDIPYEGAPENVSIAEAEIEYLLSAVNRYFKQTLRREDVVETFSGVRPLYDDGKGNPSAVTRDYVFDLDTTGGAPLLNVFGGKITTFRKLAEHAMQRLQATFPKMGPDWTVKGVLPGGEIEGADVPRFLDKLQRDYPWLPRSLARHYTRAYGARTQKLINAAASVAALGQCFGPNFYEAEVHYLMKQEWAETAQDILTRRTKHALHMTTDEKAAFGAWFDGQMARSA